MNTQQALSPPSTPKNRLRRRAATISNVTPPSTSSARFSRLLTSVLGSPFLTTAEMATLPPHLDLVDGADAAVPRADTVTRPPSPDPADWALYGFDVVTRDERDQAHDDADWPFKRASPFRSILPRLWDVLSASPPRRSLPFGSSNYSSSSSGSNSAVWGLAGTGGQKQAWKQMQIDYAQLPPLDGEEGELVDDEACFFCPPVRAVTGIDILALLPPELALHILALLLSAPSSYSEHSPTPAPTVLAALSDHAAAASAALAALLACRAVSRRWCALASDNAVWRAAFVARWGAPPARARASRYSTPLQSRAPSIHLPSTRPTLSRRQSSALVLNKKLPALPPGIAPPSSSAFASSSFPSSSRTPTSSASSTRSSTPAPAMQSPQPTRAAPLALDWRAMYAARLELERRWEGRAYAAPVPAFSSTTTYASNAFPPSAAPYASTSLANAFPSVSISAPANGLSATSSLLDPFATPPHSLSPSVEGSPRASVAAAAAPARWEPTATALAGHADSVYCLEFSRTHILTGSRDRSVKVWSLRTGRLLGTLGGSAAAASVPANAGGAVGGNVQTGAANGGVNGATAVQAQAHVGGAGGNGQGAQGHKGSVLCLKFELEPVAGGQLKGTLVTGSSDCTVCVWDLWTDPPPANATGEECEPDEAPVHGAVRAVLRGHGGGVLDLRVDGRWIVSCSKDAAIRVWDRRTLALHRTLRGHEGPVNAVGLQSGEYEEEGEEEEDGASGSGSGSSGSSSSSTGGSNSNSGTLSRRHTMNPGHRPSTTRRESTSANGHSMTRESTSINGRPSPNDRRSITRVNTRERHSGRVVSASGDGKMILWDIASGERVRTFEGHDRGLACIEFKEDLIISGSNDCKIKIWSASTGACLRTLVGHEALVRALAFDARAGRLVSASYDKSVRVWDLATGRALRVVRDSHTSHIFDVKFDGRRIVSTSHDQKIVVLDFSGGLGVDPELIV